MREERVKTRRWMFEDERLVGDEMGLSLELLAERKPPDDQHLITFGHLSGDHSLGNACNDDSSRASRVQQLFLS
jgi:predicted secreted protein